MSAAAPPTRSDAVDVLKGIGILFVVTNHCFTRGVRKFTGAPVTDDVWLYAINRAIHFAVPLFLFIACTMLVRSLSRSNDLRRYGASRWRRTAVPYLIASSAYFLLLAGPPWASAGGWGAYFAQLATGKASFHLYFTIVLIQATLVLPLLVRAMGARRLDWRHAFALGVGLQLAVFALQRSVFHWERPGSWLLWYMVPLTLGLAVGTCPEIKELLRPKLRALGLLALIAGVAYAATSVSHLRGIPSSSDLINGTYAVYTGALALWFWGRSEGFPTGHLRRAMAALGRVSLPLFLVHPAVMYLLGGPRATTALASVPLPVLVYWALTLGISYVVTRAVTATNWGRWALGELAPSPPLFAFKKS